MDQLEIGDVRIGRVVEFSGPVGLTTEGFFPGSDPGVWQENRDWLAPRFVTAADDQVQTAVQTWVVRSEGRTILVDTGLGNGKERPYVPVWSHYDSDYLADLAALGVAPGDVDLVVNTHLHLDHVGWNTRLEGREWVPTFPNAQYLVHRADFDFWNPEGDATPGFGRGNQNAFEDSVAPVQAAGQLQLWDGERHRIDGSLVLELAAGHTPGSAVVTLDSKGESAVFAADLLHSPLQVSHPELASCFCEDPAAARTSRDRLLSHAADRGALILPAHFRAEGAARIGRKDDAFTITEWAAFA
ncbi:MBL fold metallo-hydrolase [Streptomyces sp. CA-111067]|uniref:MBL fold metallo-hydrolase n=1 Tax=Streptomyces sp. CA-111067 TaxID=3240046 RepID=UPI003D98BE4E